MDNVTHSLAGLLIAESAVQLRARRPGAGSLGEGGALVAIAAMVAANLPDADLLYAGIGGERLGYMLQHRGYTHTVLGAAIGALLVWGVALSISRSTRASGYRTWLLGLLLASIASHLVLDWTNSYGVHLFWPIENRWAYGDAVFIVEPWLWVVAVPALVMATTSRVARVLLALVLAIGLVLAWRVSLVSRGAALALTMGAAISIALAWRLPARARVTIAVCGWIAVTLVMFAASALARTRVERAVRSADPSADLLDVALTPLPSNAVCLTALTVERSGASYRVETARVSTAPWISGAERCPGRGEGGLLHASSRASTPFVHWDGEWTASSDTLRALARESCPALAALRFIRVPIWHAEGDSLVRLGDVRYGGGGGNGFSDVTVPRRSTTCPRAVPPWIPPRLDVIGS